MSKSIPRAIMAASLFAAPCVRAQSTVDPKLAAQATITLDSARAIAQHLVAHGTVAAQELEREHGRLIYSFDMKVPGRPGIDEVNVDARNGAVIGVHHERPAAEQREAREDSIAAGQKSSAATKP